jgi:hypothetical protein
MAVQLCSQAGEVTLSNANWYKAVQLACRHGFQPPKRHPTLLPREPFILSASAAAAFHAALTRALPEILEKPDALYQLFERELLGNDIPTVEARLHFAGKQPLLERILAVMQGQVTVSWVADTVMPQ